MSLITRSINQFEFSVRKDFSLDNPPKRAFSHIDNRLTCDRYPLREDLLGKRFLVDVQMFEREARLDDALIAGALDDGYVLPGVIGAVLFPNFCTTELQRIATDAPVICPDIKEFLYKKDGAHRIPYFVRKNNGLYSLHVMKMKAKIFVGTYIILLKQI